MRRKIEGEGRSSNGGFERKQAALMPPHKELRGSRIVLIAAFLLFSFLLIHQVLAGTPPLYGDCNDSQFDYTTNCKLSVFQDDLQPSAEFDFRECIRICVVYRSNRERH